MKKILMLAVSMLFSASIFAGYVQPAPLTIETYEDGSGFAQGDMVTVRNSKSKNEIIGCGVRVFDDGAGGTFTTGFCQATDDEETRVVCTIANEGLIAGLASVADASFLTFSFNEFGECTRIGSSTQSMYLEKGKANKAPKVDDE